MKKFVLMFAVATIAISTSAQLKVNQSGQVLVGTIPSRSLTPSVDTLATIRVCGSGNNYSGGRISFGDGDVKSMSSWNTVTVPKQT